MFFCLRIKTNFGVMFLLLLGIFSFVSGCSVLSTARRANVFTLEKSWARHTVDGEYLGSRVNHTMSPLLFNDLVIQGNEIDSLTAYHQKTGRLKWRRKILGGVTSSAKLNDGVVYFGAGDGFFYAVDARSGATKWSFPIRSEGIGTPLVDNGIVYFVSGTNSAYALKKENGEQVWFYNRVDAASLTVRGASEPSIAEESVLIGFSDGYIVALDKNKGALKWERQIGESLKFRDVDSKPVVDGERVYVSSYDGKLYCLDIHSGQNVWVNDEGGFTSVTIAGDMLFYSTSTQKVMALEKSYGKVIWKVDLTNTVATQPIVYRGLVIFGEWSGALRALDQKTGQPVAYFRTGWGVTSAPALNQNTNYVYVMSANANLFALRLQLGNKLGDWVWEN